MEFLVAEVSQHQGQRLCRKVRQQESQDARIDASVFGKSRRQGVPCRVTRALEKVMVNQTAGLRAGEQAGDLVRLQIAQRVNEHAIYERLRLERGDGRWFQLSDIGCPARRNFQEVDPHGSGLAQVARQRWPN